MQGQTLRAVARRMSTDSWSSAALVSTMSATALPSSVLASDRLTLLSTHCPQVLTEKSQKIPQHLQVILIADRDDCGVCCGLRGLRGLGGLEVLEEGTAGRQAGPVGDGVDHQHDVGPVKPPGGVSLEGCWL